VKKSDVVVELDPGMSFGTGQHPTTRFCLLMIDRLSGEGRTGSFLDAGCGSGILSLAAFKLGYRPAVAFDNDPEAVSIAKDNLSKCGLKRGNVHFFAAGLEKVGPSAHGKFDIVAANIIAPVLMANAKRLLSLLKPDGRLIVAGILNEEYPQVRRTFVSLGMKELASASEKEWTGGMFKPVVGSR